MNTVQVRFLGSGDACGSGGRFQTCMLIKATGSTFLLDCGAAALIAMRRFGVAQGEVDMILLTHLHGAHFGGIPFVVLNAQLISKRTHPFVIVGPPGTKKRLMEAMEAFFPGSSQAPRTFSLDVQEFEFEQPHALGEATVTPSRVQHASGDPALALRIACAGKIITSTGDPAWTETLVPAKERSRSLERRGPFF